MRVLLIFFILFFSNSLYAQHSVTAKADFEAIILKEGVFFLGDQKTSLNKFRNIFKEYSKQHDQMYIRLYLERGVEYNYIEKFKKTFPKLDCDITMEFTDLDPDDTLLSVAGSVVDEFGNGLKNISIIAKGTRKGTITSGSGYFSLEFPSSMESLVIHQKHYRKIEVPYNELVSMNLENLSFTLSK